MQAGDDGHGREVRHGVLAEVRHPQGQEGCKIRHKTGMENYENLRNYL